MVAAVQKPTWSWRPTRRCRGAAEFGGNSFFPHNAVEYFVSYYDYYQARGLRPVQRHLHREGQLDQRPHRADAPVRDQGAAVWRDTIVVATVSAIYRPQRAGTTCRAADPVARRARRPARAAAALTTLVPRNEMALDRHLPVRSETIDVFPAESDLEALRIELFDGEIEAAVDVRPLAVEDLLDISSRIDPPGFLRSGSDQIGISFLSSDQIIFKIDQINSPLFIPVRSIPFHSIPFNSIHSSIPPFPVLHFKTGYPDRPLGGIPPFPPTRYLSVHAESLPLHLSIPFYPFCQNPFPRNIPFVLYPLHQVSLIA